MQPTITLTIVNGPLEGTKFVFDEPCQPVIGRANDCTIQLPETLLHARVSRHHCLLEIDPPEVQVRDLGSLNGTFVNGEEVGNHEDIRMRRESPTLVSAARALNRGDELEVGGVEFRIEVAGVEERRIPVYWPPSFE
jgi:pSer/pThr/pTyr-binding forkhead associated (FHA) protein